MNNFTVIPLAIDTSKWSNSFRDIGTAIKELAKNALDFLIVPAALAFLIVVLVMQLVKIGSAYRQGHGEDMKGKIFPLAITIIALILVASYGFWAWTNI